MAHPWHGHGDLVKRCQSLVWFVSLLNETETVSVRVRSYIPGYIVDYGDWKMKMVRIPVPVIPIQSTDTAPIFF